ncbi:hypothetical protein A9D60_19985 [Leisingera sp. JC1]|nr:hypothetical protein A9D60_19985 [Leisingera sp. JC1]
MKTIFVAAYVLCFFSGTSKGQQIIIETQPLDPLDEFPLCLSQTQVIAFTDSKNWSLSPSSNNTWLVTPPGLTLRYRDGDLTSVSREAPGDFDEFMKLAFRRQIDSKVSMQDVEFTALPTAGLSQLSMIQVIFQLPNDRRIIYHFSTLAGQSTIVNTHLSSSDCEN